MILSVPEIKSTHFLEMEQSINASQVLGEPPAYVTFNHPVHTKVEARLNDESIIVTGHVDTTIGQICGRCLAKFERTIDGDFEQVFNIEGDEIDITDEIRQTIYVDLPINAVCKESCQGICHLCGINRNLKSCTCHSSMGDSRWDVLKDFGTH